MINDILGTNIRVQRLKLNWTQEKLAESLCVTSQAISRWENGTATPDIATVCSLAGIFSVSPDELCGISTVDIDRFIESIEKSIHDSQSTHQSLCELWNEVERILINYPTNDELLYGALKLLRAIHDRIETDDQKESVNNNIYKICMRILDFSKNDVYHSFANYNLALYHDEQVVMNRCSEEDLQNAVLAKRYADVVLYSDMHKTFYHTFGATTEKEIRAARVKTLLEMLDMSKRSCSNLMSYDKLDTVGFKEIFKSLSDAEEKVRAILL